MSSTLDSVLDAGRIVDIAANDAAEGRPSRMFRVEADWPGGGFAYTLPFVDAGAAHTWALRHSLGHADAVIVISERAAQPVNPLRSLLVNRLEVPA